jgi:hypothetical protein
MRKQIAIVLASAACALATGAAHAGNVYWSVGISAPPVGTVISNAPVMAPVPVVVAAPVYAPAPVYVPAPVIYEPAPVYMPAPVFSPRVIAPRVVYRTGYVPYVQRQRHHHHDEYGVSYEERRWAPVPVDPRRQHHDYRDR